MLSLRGGTLALMPVFYARAGLPRDVREMPHANGCFPATVSGRRMSQKGRQAVFESPVGPLQSGQRASDENCPKLARSGAPFFAPELGLRHSKVRRRRLQSPKPRLGANATGSALAVGAVARLLNACEAARGTDATGHNINRCLRETCQFLRWNPTLAAACPPRFYLVQRGRCRDPFCASIRQVSDTET